jgi:hypothetical protein
MDGLKDLDEGHIGYRFPQASNELVSQLARANLMRRQFLEYCKTHSQKVGGGSNMSLGQTKNSVEKNTVPQPQPINPVNPTVQVEAAKQPLTDQGAERTVRGAPTEKTKTTISTFRPQNEAIPEAGLEDENRSLTSSVTSTGTTGGDISVPNPSHENQAFNGQPFVCPYCCKPMEIPRVSKKHAVKFWR